jgi:hypothetical protein
MAPGPEQSMGKAPRRGRWFWLSFGLTAMLLAAVALACPDLPRRWFGIASAPSGREDTPGIPVSMTGEGAIPRPVPVGGGMEGPVGKPLQVPPPSTPGPVPSAPTIAPGRAEDTPAGNATARAALFAGLDDRDELSRAHDTDPNLVVIHGRTGDSLAVPIASLDDPTPVAGDPVAWIERQRARGPVALLLQGRRDFIATSLPADALGAVERADLAAIMAGVRTEFAQRRARLEASDHTNEAMAWYELARFAYRHRLDEPVTELLDRALALDRHLLATVREDRATLYFGRLVCQAQDGNRVQAEAYRDLIRRRYADTPHGRQALAYDVASPAPGLPAAPTAGTASVAGSPPSAAAPNAPANADDEARADALVRQGRKPLAQAMNLPATEERNRLYREAWGLLQQARALYVRCCQTHPERADLQRKLDECNLMAFAAHRGETL